MTLNRRVQIEGWNTWSVKDGVGHVQPPSAVLERMLTVRLHIDDADEDNGCLQVFPGTHRLGVLSPHAIERVRASHAPVHCRVTAAGALFMKPLLLHSSQKAVSPRRRRVVHLEYSDYELPPAVNWA